MKKPKTKPIDRKKINEALLADRLGLDEPWIERWQQGRGWRQESSALEHFPKFIERGHSSAEIENIETDVDRLVAAGCQRSVVYFCLQQLSAGAQWLRAGGERRPVRKIVSAVGDEEFSMEQQVPEFASREDLEAVANTARAARRQIHRYQRELLLIAASAELPLPVGLVCRPEFSEDTLALLENSLTWTAQLADAYTTPFESTLLKSKGVLYLTVYVFLFAASTELTGSRSSNLHRGKAKPSGARRAKRQYVADNPLTSILTILTRRPWSLSELRDKVRGFKADHPGLYKRLATKLRELHDFTSA
jgi:hypothetical protein